MTPLNPVTMACIRVVERLSTVQADIERITAAILAECRQPVPPVGGWVITRVINASYVVIDLPPDETEADTPVIVHG